MVFVLVKMRTMSTQKTSKINDLLQKWTPGVVLSSVWLTEQGVSKDLSRRYVASGWLKRVGRGAYMRAGDLVDWQGAVYALQSQLGLTVHVAGLSALQMKGLGHYLPVAGASSVLLVSDVSERLPFWFLDRNWGVAINHRCVHLFDLPAGVSLGTAEHKGFKLSISSPERAAFELLYCVGDNAAFEHALTVFGGLGTLRPLEVQNLLQACRSIRVKRLFLWMARVCSHPWRKHIDLNAVELGSGNRRIYEGGELDPELLITVPQRKEVTDV